jgi:putative flippase GtrA
MRLLKVGMHLSMRMLDVGGLQGVHMAKFLGLVTALAVFSGWMNIVGNPHVVETVIGLVLAVIAGFWVFLKARKF